MKFQDYLNDLTYMLVRSEGITEVRDSSVTNEPEFHRVTVSYCAGHRVTRFISKVDAEGYADALSGTDFAVFSRLIDYKSTVTEEELQAIRNHSAAVRFESVGMPQEDKNV